MSDDEFISRINNQVITDWLKHKGWRLLTVKGAASIYTHPEMDIGFNFRSAVEEQMKRDIKK